MNFELEAQHAPSERLIPKLVLPPFMAGLAARLQGTFRWANQKYAKQRLSKRLKVSETVSLGEKRFVSILQVDGAQFLIGGTANSVSLLATLGDSSVFADVLERQSAAAAEQL